MILDVADLVADDLLSEDEAREQTRWAEICGLEPDADFGWREAA